LLDSIYNPSRSDIQRSSPPVSACPRCHAPKALCYCALLPVLPTQTRVRIIVHRNELYRTSGTANTAHLCLPNSEILPYGIADQGFDASSLAAAAGSILYLFPESNAETLDAGLLAALPSPLHLVVPDGSWAQAKRIRRRTPVLQTIRAVRLPAGVVSRYQLRRAHEEHQLCTLEAIAYALGIIEDKKIQEGLLAALDIQVERMKCKRPRFTRLPGHGEP